jgi:hypothetical protein
MKIDDNELKCTIILPNIVSGAKYEIITILNRKISMKNIKNKYLLSDNFYLQK